jgi:hypothetical protein
LAGLDSLPIIMARSGWSPVHARLAAKMIRLWKSQNCHRPFNSL